jgi:DegV family protein with EDD domain
MIQTADTLKYLHMGGRIGKAKHLVGTILNIKPLISMENGIIVALGQERSRKRAYEAIAKLVEKTANSNPIKIAYVHAAALEEVEKIKFEVEKRVKIIETIFAELSPALGVHSGPGTAGVCFYPVS